MSIVSDFSLIHTPLGSLALAVGALGLVGMTFFVPIFAVFAHQFRKCIRKLRQGDLPIPVSPACSPHSELQSITLVIPAHNEAAVLEKTIRSIQQALSHAELLVPTDAPFQVTVLVVANSCTDSTAGVAAALNTAALPIQVHEVACLNKWQALGHAMQQDIQTTWVGWVDAGTLWPENLISEFLVHASTPTCIGIAPAYAPRVGLVMQTYWSLEREIKGIENHAGGPVSIHGATVFYKTLELKKALSTLQSLLPMRPWINDDVVVPVVLRALYPLAEIRYLPHVRLDDAGLERSRKEFRRRSRMVIGNIQWMTALLPWVLQHSPKVSLLLMRRLLRVFWAYWVALIIFGISPIFLFLCILLIAPGFPVFIYTFRAAILASLQAPWVLWCYFRNPEREIHWK